MGLKLPDGTIKDACLENIEPGEPFFVLRARDLTGANTVDCWIGQNLPHLGHDHPKIREAREQADKMRHYPKRRLAD